MSYESVIDIGHMEDYYPNFPPDPGNDILTQSVRRSYSDDNLSMSYQSGIAIGRPDHNSAYPHTPPDHGKDSQIDSGCPSCFEDSLSLSYRFIGRTDHCTTDTQSDLGKGSLPESRIYLIYLLLSRTRTQRRFFL